jgi:porin
MRIPDNICRTAAIGCLLGLTALLGGADHAKADDLTHWLDGRFLTGDWGGVRTDLENAGFAPKAILSGETAGNFNGGMNKPGKATGTDYSQSLAFGFDANLEKMMGVHGTNVHFLLVDRVGRDLNQDIIGNKVQTQENYGQGQDFRISEIDFDTLLLDDKVKVKGGFFPFGNDFGWSPFFCNFQAFPLCNHLLSMPSDSGWLDGPRGNWAGFVKLQPTPEYYVQAGVSSVNPSYTALVPGSKIYSANGFKMDLSGATGAIFPVEFGWLHGFGPNDLKGDVKIGGYFDDSPYNDVLNTHTRSYGRYGWYGIIDQKLFNETPGSKRGLNVFTAFGQGDRYSSPTLFSWTIGGVYQGTFANRDDDSINFFYMRNYINNRQLFVSPTYADDETYEGTMELNYSAQVTPWLKIRPGFQYIMNPGAYAYKTAGSQNWKDAVVYETTFQLTF